MSVELCAGVGVIRWCEVSGVGRRRGGSIGV